MGAPYSLGQGDQQHNTHLIWPCPKPTTAWKSSPAAGALIRGNSKMAITQASCTASGCCVTHLSTLTHSSWQVVTQHWKHDDGQFAQAAEFTH